MNDNEMVTEILVAMIARGEGFSMWESDPVKFTDWVIESHKKLADAVKKEWQLPVVGAG